MEKIIIEFKKYLEENYTSVNTINSYLSDIKLFLNDIIDFYAGFYNYNDCRKKHH